jgi:hypothetical protein
MYCIECGYHLKCNHTYQRNRGQRCVRYYRCPNCEYRYITQELFLKQVDFKNFAIYIGKPGKPKPT